MKSTIKISFLLCLLLGGSAVGAATNRMGQTVITSDTLLFDYQRSIAVFEGTVKVVDAQVTLTCEKLYVYFNDSNEIDAVVARENVHIVQGDRHAKAGRAVYRASEGSIVLTENARLYRGVEELQGDEIEIFTTSEKVLAKPARLLVVPRGADALRPQPAQP